MSPAAGFALNAQLLSSLYKQQETQSKNDQALTDMQGYFQLRKPIEKLNYWVATFCFRKKYHRDYKKLIEKSKHSLTKELDLRKFVQRQRVTMTAILGLLSGR